MFFNKIKKIISIILIILILAPSVFFIKPQKTEAFADNFAFEALGYVQGSISAGYNAISAASQKSIALKELVLDGIAWGLKEVLIRQIVASTVDWINNGFDGNPAFVTDFDGLLESTGDKIVGEWILGGKLNSLDSSFNLPVRLALLEQFTQTNQFQSTLPIDLNSSISDLDRQWDWDTWDLITQNSNNNPYGAYIDSSQAINRNIEKEINQLTQELGWGDGFLSFKDCPAEGEAGPCNIVTPGSVIASTLNEHINIQGRELVAADEISEIIGALFGQLVKKVTGPEGLLSASSNSIGQSSLVNQLSNQQADLFSLINETDKSINKDINNERNYINPKQDSLNAVINTKSKLEILISCYDSRSKTLLSQSVSSTINNQIQPMINRLTNEINISSLNIQNLESIKTDVINSSTLEILNLTIEKYISIQISGDLKTIENIVNAKLERDGLVDLGIIKQMNTINIDTDKKLKECQNNFVGVVNYI